MSKSFLFKIIGLGLKFRCEILRTFLSTFNKKSLSDISRNSSFYSFLSRFSKNGMPCNRAQKGAIIAAIEILVFYLRLFGTLVGLVV
jgi:hypothetical protein